MHWNDDNGITDGEKFVSLLEPENAGGKFDIFYVSEYQFPENIESYDGYLLTGSPVSVHDKDEWIKMLSEFVGKVHKKNKPIVGQQWVYFFYALCQQTLKAFLSIHLYHEHLQDYLSISNHHNFQYFQGTDTQKHKKYQTFHQHFQALKGLQISHHL